MNKRLASGEAKPAAAALNGLRVGIVGGGLSGLACALALRLKDESRSIVSSIKVYERDRVFADRRQGFGLTLTNNPKGPLAALGLLDDCISGNCPSTCHYVFTPSGGVLGYYGRAFKGDREETYDSNRVGNLRIPRQHLRMLLLNKLDPGTIRWSCQIKDYQETETGVRIEFENGEVDEVDVLVGADGFNSAVRRLRDDKARVADTAPSYLGICVVLGLSTLEHPLVADRGFYVLDGSHRLFVMPFQQPSAASARLTMWQLSFSGLNQDEADAFKAYSPLELHNLAIEKTASWFSTVGEMIRNTELKEVWGTALFDRPKMTLRKRWEETRVVVIGDACHPMSMFKGQGANQALGDGPLLASWLLKEGLTSSNIHTRLRCFEQEMVSKTTPKVEASRAAALLLHSKSCLDDFIGIEGVPEHLCKEALRHCQKRNIQATDGSDLDDNIRSVLSSLLKS